MTDKDAMKLALDALETEVSIDWTNNDEFNASAEKMHEAITALKERLADPMREVQRLGQEIEQGPVAYFHPHKGFYWAKPTSISAPTIADVEPLPLYTHTPKENT